MLTIVYLAFPKIRFTFVYFVVHSQKILHLEETSTVIARKMPIRIPVLRSDTKKNKLNIRQSTSLTLMKTSECSVLSFKSAGGKQD